eukprot:jgi/Mesen1/3835/ME000207S02845
MYRISDESDCRNDWRVPYISSRTSHLRDGQMDNPCTLFRRVSVEGIHHPPMFASAHAMLHPEMQASNQRPHASAVLSSPRDWALAQLHKAGPMRMLSTKSTATEDADQSALEQAPLHMPAQRGRPVFWCPVERRAKSDHEICHQLPAVLVVGSTEGAHETSTLGAYVALPVRAPPGSSRACHKIAELGQVFALVFTDRAWTIPAMTAVAAPEGAKWCLVEEGTPGNIEAAGVGPGVAMGAQAGVSSEVVDEVVDPLRGELSDASIAVAEMGAAEGPGAPALEESDSSSSRSVRILATAVQVLQGLSEAVAIEQGGGAAAGGGLSSGAWTDLATPVSGADASASAAPAPAPGSAPGEDPTTPPWQDSPPSSRDAAEVDSWHPGVGGSGKAGRAVPGDAELTGASPYGGDTLPHEQHMARVEVEEAGSGWGGRAEAWPGETLQQASSPPSSGPGLIPGPAGENASPAAPSAAAAQQAGAQAAGSTASRKPSDLASTVGLGSILGLGGVLGSTLASSLAPGGGSSLDPAAAAGSGGSGSSPTGQGDAGGAAGGTPGWLGRAVGFGGLARGRRGFIVAADCVGTLTLALERPLRVVRGVPMQIVEDLAFEHPLHPARELRLVTVAPGEMEVVPYSTGLVPLVPGHSAQDYDTWQRVSAAAGVEAGAPSPVDDDGLFTQEADELAPLVSQPPIESPPPGRDESGEGEGEGELGIKSPPPSQLLPQDAPATRLRVAVENAIGSLVKRRQAATGGAAGDAGVQSSGPDREDRRATASNGPGAAAADASRVGKSGGGCRSFSQDQHEQEREEASAAHSAAGGREAEGRGGGGGGGGGGKARDTERAVAAKEDLSRLHLHEEEEKQLEQHQKAPGQDEEDERARLDGGFERTAGSGAGLPGGGADARDSKGLRGLGILEEGRDEVLAALERVGVLVRYGDIVASVPTTAATGGEVSACHLTAWYLEVQRRSQGLEHVDFLSPYAFTDVKVALKV